MLLRMTQVLGNKESEESYVKINKMKAETKDLPLGAEKRGRGRPKGSKNKS